MRANLSDGGSWPIAPTSAGEDRPALRGYSGQQIDAGLFHHREKPSSQTFLRPGPLREEAYHEIIGLLIEDQKRWHPHKNSALTRRLYLGGGTHPAVRPAPVRARRLINPCSDKKYPVRGIEIPCSDSSGNLPARPQNRFAI